ncbi:hypothetical protein Nepgr_006468 [Nepenthes gracilis]|uniref:Fibronectin type-III domain-containing protein n=1 Tax=Nepenthes gracilis TaxID=150966 RepID=A0AAD3S565_NEPGR|nr:hypothetical protein Nepgr_006468 [Nepenthes gracilis]
MAKRFVLLHFLLMFISLSSVNSNPNSRPTPPTTAHKELTNYGFPIGLLPANVRNYVVNQTTGKFSVNLGDHCEITLPPDNYLATYSKTITGKIVEHRIEELDGIRVWAFFKWWSITGIRSSGDHLVFELSEKLVAEELGGTNHDLLKHDTSRFGFPSPFPQNPRFRHLSSITFLVSCRYLESSFLCARALLIKMDVQDKKQKASLKGKMTEHQLKVCNKTSKNQDSKKAYPSLNNQASSRKQNRKGENPTRFTPVTEQFFDFGCSSSWICKNSACRAVLSIDDSFCRRCSCCICHQFDDNKDPSLWLVCESESGQDDSCGLSCHIECALQRQKVGVVNLGQFLQLDGSYCCASCGKVSGILRCWKKQLIIAKDARRVDVLCYRIFLSYRLLDGSSRFELLHEIISDAKKKLEAEVGPINGDSVKMARGIVSRLSIAGDVQKLCSHAIEKADEWLANASIGNTSGGVDSLPAACRFLFEEVTSSSVVIVLIELPIPLTDSVRGYKIWYCKSRQESFSKEPISIFPREKRRISISNLQPCTEYTFRIVSYTEAGDLGHSEAKCFTRSVEIIRKNAVSSATIGLKKENSSVEGSSSDAKEHSNDTPANRSSCEFKVRDLGKILHLAWAQEQGAQEGFCSADIEQCCGGSKPVKKIQALEDHQSPPASRDLDLNVVSVPDLNEDLIPPFECSRDEDNGCTLEHTVEADDDAASHGHEKNGQARSRGDGDPQVWPQGPNEEGAAVDSRAETCRKRSLSANEEAHECDSTLVNGSPFRISGGSGHLDENFESCVKTIRRLECQGYLKPEFRLKLLTWFSLRSTEQERRVVNTFIRTLIDDPRSLAGQLVDSFSDIVNSKRQRNGFCNKLWH